MQSNSSTTTRARQGGFALVAITALVTVLMATGLAFMRWNVDESAQSAQTTAAIQAYYLGQLGVVERGFQFLRQLPANQLPTAMVVLPGREVPGFGKYENVRIHWLVPEGESGNFFAIEKRYKIVADGIVDLPFHAGNRALEKKVTRRSVLYVQVRNFADYMYLSNIEEAAPGDIIRFWHGDTLQGRVHSNAPIAIRDDPVFYATVSSCADDYIHGPGANPGFYGSPPTRWGADSVEIPSVAENLRACASGMGHYYDHPGMVHRATFNRTSMKLVWWPQGTPFDSSRSLTFSISGQRTCVFVTSDLDVSGIVEGQVTLGCSGTMRLLDNVRYADADPLTGMLPDGNGDGVPEGTNILGLVSEADVKVANTWENGRENSSHLGQPAQTNPAFCDIVITAAVVALGESFEFEQQNDPDSGYVYTENGIPHRDDRGTIYLFGSLTQMRRGYVHRTTNGSTGYLKQYRYDKRLLFTRPPGFFDAKDRYGRALFDVVQWGRGVPDQVDVQQQIYEKFN